MRLVRLSEVRLTRNRALIATLILSFSFFGLDLTVRTSASANVRTGGVPTRIRSIHMGPSSGACGSTIVATARLEYRISAPDNLVPLEGKTLTFNLGSSTASGTTDANGVATASITVPSDATSLSALFAGDEEYNSSDETIAFSYSGLCGLTPASQCFTPDGGPGVVSLSASPNHVWTATSDSSWVTITSESTGTGSGTISFFVDPNPESVRRIATITIDQQVFTVKQGASFADVGSSHLFFTEISILSANGITSGCQTGLYCPDSEVTREQMAAFLSRALNVFNPPEPSSQRFADVPPSSLFYRFIEEMADRQITLGCGGGNYCPSQPVTREQMAAFMIRALGEFSPPSSLEQRFADVPPENPFFAFIDRMAVLGITQGCGQGIYCPQVGVTRGQMAAFLVRAFDLCQQ